MEIYLESLSKAVRNMRIADHMLYVTYPVIKDKRLLLKCLEQTHEAACQAINAILQHDYLFKRILACSDNTPANLCVFSEKCSKRYNITEEELNSLKELISLAENHKKSPIEFQRKDKIAIMSDSLRTTLIDSEKLKKCLNLVKNLINKAKFGMSIQ